MDIDGITAFIESLGGVLVLEPGPGDGATVVTKDYPDDESSNLNRDGAFRVNVASGAAEFRARIGREPREPRDAEREPDPSTVDVVIAHPVYGELGWLSVVNPGPGTQSAVQDLLSQAHTLARARSERRTTS